MEISYMAQAMDLAERARGYTKTNPLVGAVIVKNNKVVGRGYHRFFGGDHAEVMALKEAGEESRGSSVYVTLEPCCHFGKTPPCTQALIDAGVSKVFIAMKDCDSRVAGRGIEILREAGIEVHLGIMEEEAKWQNRAFIKSNTVKMPYVSLKYAASLDGKIATVTGQSKWITGEESRLDGHRYRAIVDGILIGSKTALEDNPSLNNRSGQGKNPIKILLDRELKVPIDYNIYKNEPELTLVCTSTTDRIEWEKREALGAKLLFVEEKNGKIDLKDLLKKLYQHKLGHILVEGGGQVHGSFVQEHLFDEVLIYMAPILIGGKEAKLAVSGQGISSLSLAPKINIVNIEKLGDDIKIHGVKKCSQE